jgi:glycosyltransferase involved in cell wall biosynthesis
MKWDLIIDCINVRGFHIDSWIIKFTEQPKYLALIFQTAEEVWDEMLPFPLSTIGRRILEPYWLSKYKKSKILTICNSSAESLIKYGLKDVRVLNPGFEFDPDFESPKQFNISRSDQTVEIVFCARLVGMKRPKDAIDALRSISAMDKSRKYRLHIIGDGKLRKKLEDYAKNLNLSIIFHGRISNYERNSIYSKSHFLIATSVREGWGLTVSEAAYYGCIPLVYDVPGLRDSANLVGGFVVEEDSQKLANKMKEIVGSEKQISNSIGRIQTWEETAREFLAVAE